MRIDDKEKLRLRFKKAKEKEEQLKTFEYLIHHIAVEEDGEEIVHHCFLYDHIANLFKQEHIVVKDGKVFLGGKEIKEGVYHVIVGLEPTQEVAWSNEDAIENGVTLKRLKVGMTLKEKSKEW